MKSSAILRLFGGDPLFEVRTAPAPAVSSVLPHPPPLRLGVETFLRIIIVNSVFQTLYFILFMGKPKQSPRHVLSWFGEYNGFVRFIMISSKI